MRRSSYRDGLARLVVVSSIVLIVSAACSTSPVEGDGEVVTETRSVAGFSAVSVTNGAEMFLTVDPSTSGAVELSVTTDANLLEVVTTEVSGETLNVSIDSEGEPRPTRGFEITGTVGTVRDVETSDGGEATVTGPMSTVNLSATNAGRINAEALEAEDVDVDADNGGLITICATGSITGTVSNGAELVVLCGGNVSGVETSNGGEITSS